jgi:hypothetical protein
MDEGRLEGLIVALGEEGRNGSIQLGEVDKVLTMATLYNFRKVELSIAVGLVLSIVGVLSQASQTLDLSEFLDTIPLGEDVLESLVLYCRRRCVVSQTSCAIRSTVSDALWFEFNAATGGHKSTV